MRSDADTIDLREVASALRRGRWWILAGVLFGISVAVAVTMLVPPRYEATTTILLRDMTGGATSALGGSGSSEDGGISLGGLADVLSLGSGFDTEMEILTSRSVVAAVIDSLDLQARVLEPEAVSPISLFATAQFARDQEEEKYRFEREGDRYRVTGSGASDYAIPGVPYHLGDAAVVTLRSRGLPESFEIELVSLDEAIEHVEDHLDPDQAGGDIAELVYTADDPRTAAAVPNAMVIQYLARRKTTDRGINQRQYELLAEHTDSIAVVLAAAESQLRAYQERSGVLDPELAGETEMGGAMALRGNLEQLQIEARALEQVLNRDPLSPQELAAYPTLLRNPSFNNLLSRLSEKEAQRAGLLERRTEQDPEVVLLTKNIRQLENELFTLARAYLDGLNKQQIQIQDELRGYQEALSALPEQAEEIYGLQREVTRLSETLTALQTQLVQTRLAVIAEGGGVRSIDRATAPDEPEFPKPFLNLAIGLFGGLVLGCVTALGRVYMGERVEGPRDAELATGIPALVLDSRVPLLLNGTEKWRSVLVIPIGDRARANTVAHQLAETAALQGESVVLVDIEEDGLRPRALGSGPGSGTALVQPGEEPATLLEPEGNEKNPGYPVYRRRANGAADPRGVRSALQELEQRFSLVVASVGGIGHASTAALLGRDRPVVLVARVGGVTRTELRDTVSALGRAGIVTSGVVLHNGSNGGGPNA